MDDTHGPAVNGRGLGLPAGAGAPGAARDPDEELGHILQALRRGAAGEDVSFSAVQLAPYGCRLLVGLLDDLTARIGAALAVLERGVEPPAPAQEPGTQASRQTPEPQAGRPEGR